MTIYKISTPHFVAAVHTAGNQVIQAPPVLSHFVTREWDEFRSFAEQNRWRIEPVNPSSLSDWLDIGGQLFEIRWSEGRKAIRRISLHEDGEVTDLRYNELPLAVRLVL